MNPTPDRVELDITTTFDDQMAFSMHALNTPPLSTMRRRREIIGVACAPIWLLGGMSLAWAVDWAFDKDAVPLPELLRLVAAYPKPLLGGMALAFAAMLLGVWFNRIRARRRIAGLLRRTLRDRADVDPSDPKLTERTRSIYDATGITSETALGHGTVKWAAVKRLEETADHLFLICGPMSGFMVPKRQLDAARLEQLRDLITTQLARATGR